MYTIEASWCVQKNTYFFLRVPLEAMIIGLCESCVVGVTRELALFDLANINLLRDSQGSMQRCLLVTPVAMNVLQRMEFH